MKKKYILVPFIFLLGAAFVYVVLLSQKQRLVTLKGKTMGTSYTVKFVPTEGLSPGQVKNIDQQIMHILEMVNQQMSTYREHSEITRFNKLQSKKWFRISSYFYNVLEDALEINQLTKGAFDITVYPLVDLWGFGPSKHKKVPSILKIQKMRSQIGSQYLEIQRSRRRIRKKSLPLSVDLSAIAKGYAVDLVSNLLLKEKLPNHLVEIGGEVKARGMKKNNNLWRVAIEGPDPSQRNIHTIVRLHNMGMATSGDYRNFFVLQGKKYSHTIDPRTGFPVTHHLASVTVFHREVGLADAWATAFSVLGPVEAPKLAQKYGIMAYFIIYKENGEWETIKSPALKKYWLRYASSAENDWR